jgi:glucokinase
MDLFAGFDLGGSRLKYGLVDTRGEVIFHRHVETPGNRGDLLSLMAECWERLSRTHGPIHSAGIGLPGIFSDDRKRILHSPHCPFIEEFDWNAACAGILGVPFVLDNEANLAAYGEFRAGAGGESRCLILLTLGSGIGTGIIMGGEIWRGACGAAAELGHMPVNPDGALCACGNRGCLETEVSAGRIVELYRELSDDQAVGSCRDVGRRALEGDPSARRAMERAGSSLGRAIAVVINLLNPDTILLGGGVMESSGFVLGPAREQAKRHSLKAAFDCCSIQPAALGNRAGFIGAALYAGNVFAPD